MFEIDKNNNITMIRGDSVRVKVECYEDDEHTIEYIPVNGERVRFALKKRYTDSTPLLLKEIPIDSMLLRIDPEDTKDLDFGPYNGKYKYDIEITRLDGFIDTFIARKDFTILEEVY